MTTHLNNNMIAKMLWGPLWSYGSWIYN